MLSSTTQLQYDIQCALARFFSEYTGDQLCSHNIGLGSITAPLILRTGWYFFISMFENLDAILFLDKCDDYIIMIRMQQPS